MTGTNPDFLEAAAPVTMALMRVFVTGGAGFLGSHVCTALLGAGHQVTVLDNLSTGHRDAVPEGAVLIEGDLKEEDALRGWLAGHDIVIHLAALVPVPTSLKHPVAFAENNVVNTVRLLENMRHAGVNRIVFSSSATVYGVPQRLPLREDHPVQLQNNPYGATKVAAEAFIAVYHKLYGFDATILRYFNPYGPNELCEPETHLIPNVVRAALTDQPIPVYWKGEQVRDFIYVEDLAQAHVAVLGQTGLNYFNVGTERGVKVNDVLGSVADILDKPLRIDDLGERPGDVPALFAASERLRKATGWQAQVDLEEGLRRTVEFFRSRLEAEAQQNRA
jgi:UDP-glucose 4-epimerase